MKKIFLSVVLIFAVSMAMAQIQRQFVLLEIGTGTWCTYCPGAAMGADDLLEAGCMVAVIENHNGDAFANQYSNARNSYYAISGYPTAIFDGVLRVVGGSHSSSMYNSYLPKYNQRMAVPSNIMMSMTAEESAERIGRRVSEVGIHVVHAVQADQAERRLTEGAGHRGAGFLHAHRSATSSGSWSLHPQSPRASPQGHLRCASAGRIRLSVRL